MTNKQRLDRIQRLVNIRERDRDEKRGALSEAQRQTELARAAQQDAETTWQERAAGVGATTVTSASEFAENRMHLADLKKHAEHRRIAHEEAEQEESERRSDAQDAQRELRKMELWSESEAEKIRKERARQDQIVTDELAALLSQRQTKR